MNTINTVPPMNGMGTYPTTPPTTPPIQPIQPMQNQTNGYSPRNPMPNHQGMTNNSQQQSANTRPQQMSQQQTMNPTQPSMATQHQNQPINHSSHPGTQPQMATQQAYQKPNQPAPPMNNSYPTPQQMPPQQPQVANQGVQQYPSNQANQSSMSNQMVSNGKQILRIDGKDAFVEIMDTKFHEGKITFHFSSYDKTKPAGQRQKDFIKFNLTFKEFMNLGHDVLYGNMMNWQPIDQYNNLRPAYMKGVPSKYNNNQAIARKLEVKNGDRQPIRLICSEGQGKETGQGLIQMVGQAEKRVQIGMSQDEFRSIFLVVPMYIQAYLNNHYNKCVK